LCAVHDNALSMETFVGYWEVLGAKVTPVSEAEAKAVRVALASSAPIDPKYLKAAVDTRKVAGGSTVAEAEEEAPKGKKKGVK
jgi:hypothetical protein